MPSRRGCSSRASARSGSPYHLRQLGITLQDHDCDVRMYGSYAALGRRKPPALVAVEDHESLVHLLQRTPGRERGPKKPPGAALAPQPSPNRGAWPPSALGTFRSKAEDVGGGIIAWERAPGTRWFHCRPGPCLRQPRVPKGQDLKRASYTRSTKKQSRRDCASATSSSVGTPP